MQVLKNSPVVAHVVLVLVVGGGEEESDTDGGEVVADSAAAGRGAILIRAHNECIFTLMTE